jgi:hypothetical protein
MRAAAPCGEADRPALFRLFDEIQKRHPYVAPLGECKVEDWGTLEGRFVMLDYGAECYEAAEIASARAGLMKWVEPARSRAANAERHLGTTNENAARRRRSHSALALALTCGFSTRAEADIRSPSCLSYGESYAVASFAKHHRIGGGGRRTLASRMRKLGSDATCRSTIVSYWR